MPNLQITAAQMASLPGFPVQASCPAQGYVGIGVLNVSPWWWTLRDETGLTIATLSPWTYTLANVARPGTQQLTVASDTSLPEVPVNGAAAGTYVLRLELSALAVAPAVTTLAVAMAANSSMSIDTSGGAVQVSQQGDVTVNGSVNATIDTAGGAVSVALNGTAEVAGNVSATIDTSGGPVQVSQQGTTTVAGNVTATIDTSGGAVETTLSGDIVVGSITETVTTSGDATITNNVLACNQLVVTPAQSLAFSVPNAGDSQTFDLSFGSTYTGDYDGIYMRISSPNAQIPNLVITINYTMLTEAGLDTSVPSSVVTWRVNNDSIGFSNLIFLNPSAVFDGLNVTIENTYQGDTETLGVQFYLRHASARVVNPTSEPVAQQAAEGEFGSLVGLTTSSVAAGAVTQIFDSGNYVTQVHLTCEAAATQNVILRLGSTTGSELHTFALSPGALQAVDLSFGGGVSMTGMWLDNSNGSDAADVSGYAVTVSTTPPMKVSTIG